MSELISKKFSCTENREDYETYLWLSNEYGEPSIHIEVLGDWSASRRKFSFFLSDNQLHEFKKQVDAL